MKKAKFCMAFVLSLLLFSCKKEHSCEKCQPVKDTISLSSLVEFDGLIPYDDSANNEGIAIIHVYSDKAIIEDISVAVKYVINNKPRIANVIMHQGSLIGEITQPYIDKQWFTLNYGIISATPSTGKNWIVKY